MNAPLIMSKGEQARKIILDSLTNGPYRPGMKIPSDNALPQQLGISRSIVREVLASLAQEGYLTRIQGKGTFVAEKAEKPGQPSVKTELVLLVCDILGPGRESHTLSELVRGMHNCRDMASHPFRLKTFSPSESPEETASAILADGRTYGMIFMGFSVGRDLERTVLEAGARALAIGRPLPGARIPFVEADHFHGGYKAAKHLIGLGHKRIALIDLECQHDSSRLERKRGYEKALKEHGLKLHKELYALCSDATDKEAELRVGQLLRTGAKFTAMTVFGDYPALGAARALRNAGKRVPEDVSMIMYSGSEWVSAALGVAMTKIVQSQFEMGEKAVELLLRPSGAAAAEGLLKTSLSLGDSCRRAKR